jgi:predicted nucleotidyltransferase
MLNKIISEIQQLSEEYLNRHTEIEVVYIFGSVAQGQSNVLSDIDFGIIVDRSKIEEHIYPYGYKAHILGDLMKLLRTNKLDLVILNDAPPLLRHRVLYYGKLIHSIDEKRRIRFQVETINKYNDYKYLSKPHAVMHIAS